MKTILFDLAENFSLRERLLAELDCDLEKFKHHQFPDGEDYLQILCEVKNNNIIILANLKNPNSQIITLIFLAATLRDQGASTIILVAPYLPYMRQDKIFKSGESLTSKHFAQLLSKYFDELITAEPHLHRYHDLNEIYSLKAMVVHVTKEIAAWIADNIKNPLLIGPDSESEQWVKDIAITLGCEYLLANKERHGDAAVAISLPHYTTWQNKIPILVDDIISSGATMIKTAELIKQFTSAPPICIGVHAIFSQQSYEHLKESAQEVITCNSIPHQSNKIDISHSIACAIKTLL